LPDLQVEEFKFIWSEIFKKDVFRDSLQRVSSGVNLSGSGRAGMGEGNIGKTEGISAPNIPTQVPP
jgi:hypothetical protein